jgi:formylglycine-generating enzyme required for sulfatase activity
VKRDREFQSWRQQLRPRIEEWRKSPADEGTLLRGGPLVVAEDWCVRRPDEFSEEERTFIAASIKYRETERDRAKEAQAREQARLTEIAAGQRRTARLQRYLFGALACVAAALVGWFNESYLRERLHWYMTMRPYMVTQVRPKVLTAERERALKPKDSFRECAKDCPEMIVIPAGEFMMGSPATETGRSDDEGPQHKVTIAKSFAVSKFDVTFADWDACVSVGGCPEVSDSGYGRGTRPVINLTWDDAGKYVKWLSRMTGRPYRLLTEAEWEYAARAGATTAYYWGDEIGKANANCQGCGSQWDNRETSPVGSFKPNAFGLYEMAGNVWQWVEDCYHDNYDDAPADASAWTSRDCNRGVGRGGSWIDVPQFLRSAYRGKNPTVVRNGIVGFRLARTLNP